jgi:hypothetical protein
MNEKEIVKEKFGEKEEKCVSLQRNRIKKGNELWQQQSKLYIHSMVMKLVVFVKWRTRLNVDMRL